MVVWWGPPGWRGGWAGEVFLGVVSLRSRLFGGFLRTSLLSITMRE